MCKIREFSNNSIWGEVIFLSVEQKFTAGSVHFSYFKYVVIIVLSVIHSTYHFFTETYVKIMLKISTS